MVDKKTPPVIVTTSDKYIDAVQTFAWLMNRYWEPNPEVFIVGFSPPTFELPDNFSFVSVGKFEDYPVDKWSDALIKFLGHFDKELFVLMLEDYWISRRVDTEGIALLAKYMDAERSIIKADLKDDRLYAGGKKSFGFYDRLDMILSDPDSAYHMSLMSGLWRKEHMLSVLKPGWSPWEVEIDGTRVLSAMRNLKVVGTRQMPLNHILAFRGNDFEKLDLSGLSEEDVSSLSRLGLLKRWNR